MIITQAPAKVNLRLIVGPLRTDGYHEVDTLMVPLQIADDIEVAFGEKGSIHLVCEGISPGIPTGKDNLAWRAADCFLRKVADRRGVRIRLVKRIPAQAGLGGGSSDAASVLAALNLLFGSPLTPEDLRQLAGTLGSDVPFFLLRGPGRCTGRGERIEPVEIKQNYPLLLVKPPFGVSTAWAYRKFREMQPPPPEDSWLCNSLETAVFEKFTLLPVMKRWLLAHPDVLGSLLCGSGSALFAVLRKGDAGEALARAIRAEFGEHLWTCVTRTSCEKAKC